jgi:hypothetical protein
MVMDLDECVGDARSGSRSGRPRRRRIRIAQKARPSARTAKGIPIPSPILSPVVRLLLPPVAAATVADEDEAVLDAEPVERVGA